MWMNLETSAPNIDFPANLKRWRKHRKLSQLELALSANVSQRHVSWLETGRSHPSRDMVVRLSNAMRIPLRDRNQILNCAGYAPLYSEHSLTEPDMEPIVSALQRMLNHHEPYPAIVIDRLWNIRMQNKAASLLFQIAGDPEQVWDAIGDTGDKNLALLTVHPKGLRQYISNFEEIAGSFLRRLKHEAADCTDSKMHEMLAKLSTYLEDIPASESVASPLLPILPLEFGPFPETKLKLSLFSMLSTFGTPQDVTAAELRIESFYPTDKATADFFSDVSTA